MNFIGNDRLFLISILILQEMKLAEEQNNLCKLMRKGNIRIWGDPMCWNCQFHGLSTTGLG